MAGTKEEGSRLPPAGSQRYESESAVRVLIVEDHLLLAESMAGVLRDHGMQVIAIARGGREAMRLAKRERPDVVLMDIGLPDMDGIDAGRHIIELLPSTKILAITGLESADVVQEALLNGFHGYLHKQAPSSELIKTIRLVASGQAVMPQDAARRLATRGNGELEFDGVDASRLTRRERDVLTLLVEGANSRQIAQRLFLSRNTVRTHVQNILAKLQVHSRLEAAAYAVRSGIVKPPNRRRRFR
jgi:DNA-binding NarL/FixJ family response regulator